MHVRRTAVVFAALALLAVAAPAPQALPPPIAEQQIEQPRAELPTFDIANLEATPIAQALVLQSAQRTAIASIPAELVRRERAEWRSTRPNTSTPAEHDPRRLRRLQL